MKTVQVRAAWLAGGMALLLLLYARKTPPGGGGAGGAAGAAMTMRTTTPPTQPTKSAGSMTCAKITRCYCSHNMGVVALNDDD